MIDVIARKLTASLFYFELDTVPERNNGGYRISRSILCSLCYHDSAYKSLLEQLVRDSAEFYADNIPLPGNFEEDLEFYDSRSFRKSVSFHSADDFTTSLRKTTLAPNHTSGSPFSVESLLTSQEFNSFFERSDHRKRKFIGDDSPRKRRRL